MAAKKKTKKKKAQPKKNRSRKPAPAKSKTKRKQATAMRGKKKAVRKTQKRKPQPAAKASAARKKPSSVKRSRTSRSFGDDVAAYPRDDTRARSGGQSGSLQGLSDIEDSNSESVDELLEEGNAFEAEAVRGVEQAGDADEEEVHTHEVPEDDIPGEYLDKD